MLPMIMIFIFLITVYGTYMILTGQLELVTAKTEKAAHAYHNRYKKSMETDRLLESLAVKLSKYVRMDAYKRKKLEADLKGLDINDSPEIYKARALLKPALILLGVIPCLLIAPILSVGVIATAIVIYFKDDMDIRERLRLKKEDMEFELPRFACTLKQELIGSRDVLTILESYKKNAGTAMKGELEKTIADMRSGDYEAALLRFESRISIPALSDIMRGLIGVLRGDNNVSYFEMLSHDLDMLEVQRLENIAMKQPGKIKKYLFMLLMSLLYMYGTILAVYTFIMVK